MNKIMKYTRLTFLFLMTPALADPFYSFPETSGSDTNNQEIYYEQNTDTLGSYPAEYPATTLAAIEEDIFSLALEAHSKQSTGDIDLLFAKTQVESIEQEYNAFITWEVEAGFSHTKNSDHNLSVSRSTNDYLAKTSVNLKKKLWDKELEYSIDSGKQNIQTARYNYFGEKQRTIESVALAYLDHLAAKDSVLIAKRHIRLFPKIKQQIERKKELGYAAEIDMVEIDNQVNETNEVLLSANTNLHKTAITLSRLIGSNNLSYYHSPFFERKNITNLQPASFLIEKALNNNIELQSLRSEQASLQKKIQSKRSRTLPKFDLVSSLSQAWKEGDSDQDVFNASIGIKMDMSLYTGGRVDNQIKQTKLQLLRAERRSYGKEQDLITQINILSTEFFGLLSSYKSLMKLKQQSNKSIRLIQSAVSFGVRENRHIYTALDNKFQLENTLIRQFYNLLKTKVKIMKLTGELNSKDLSHIKRLLQI